MNLGIERACAVTIEESKVSIVMGDPYIRIHGISPNAPAGKNSAAGWVLRVSDPAGNYYNDQGQVVPNNANEGHIPIQGNPNAK
jgi:hypothetical protein